MVKITIEIPNQLKKEMELYPEINWDVVIKNTFIDKLKKLRHAENLGKKYKE
ncbi:MAG: hypothetical protein NT038_09310 [Euryarchaeota archaeon]|nr:hypothetical protein [Euryarchaeota archaeon]